MNKRFVIVLILLAEFTFSACATNPLKLEWSKRHKEGLFSIFSNEVVENSTLVVEGNELYFGTLKGTLVSYNLEKKRIRWKYKGDSPVESTPLVVGNVVYFGTSDGNFFSLDKNTGKPNWKYHSDGEVYSKAAMHSDGIVYFATAGGVITAVDAKTGEWLWHYKRSPNKKVTIKGVSSPLLIGKDMLVLGFADGFVTALNPNDGSIIWERRLAGEGRFIDIDAEAIYRDGKIYFPTYQEGLYALDEKGNTVWKFKKGGSSSKILLDDNLYFASNTGDVFKINPLNGEEIWDSKFDEEAPTNPVIIDNLLIIATYEGSLYVFDRNDGRFLWKYRFSSTIRGNILKHDKDILLVTAKGDLFAFTPR